MGDAYLPSVLLLAVVQGATEFLPISSSGHLALAQAWLNVGQGDVFEDVLLHVGTLGAVVVFYRRDILELIRNVAKPDEAGATARRYVAYLVVGSIPAALVGLLFKDSLEGLFDRVELVLVMLALTGVLLMASRWIPHRDLPLTWGRAFVIGVAQSLAILPGLSRSGWTIVVGMAVGLPPREAARFSFLLSIPAILGATVLELAEGPETPTSAGALLLAMIVAFGVGLLCLRWLVSLATRFELYRFAPYLWAVAAVGLVALRLR